MPARSKRPCSIAGCPTLTTERWCPAHAASVTTTRYYDKRRLSASQRGYDKAWQKLRVRALERDHYLCQDCLLEGRPVEATEVDHVISISQDPKRRLDLTNLRCLCKSCHSKKTYREDGSWGRKPRKES